MTFEFPPYFFHTSAWANFWEKANLKGHKAHYFNVKHDSGLELSTRVYEFPWYFNQKFWYVAKGPYFSNENQKNNLEYKPENQRLYLSLWQQLLSEIDMSAKSQKICFLKWDFDDQFTSVFDLNSTNLTKWLDQFTTLKIVPNTKSTQYLKTITLDISEIHSLNITNKYPNSSFDSLEMLDFYQQSQAFWKTTNENIRRYTKKSIFQNWLISTEKTQENFEDFWKVYSQTSKRQDFAIRTKSYTETLFKSDLSKIIIIRSQDGSPESVWLGIETEDTLTYLYGGNTNESLKKYGQYLVHLVAVYLASSLKLKYYDLGGYDEKKGYGKFKESFHGKTRTFLGPVDIVYNNFQYKLITSLISLAKIFRK